MSALALTEGETAEMVLVETSVHDVRGGRNCWRDAKFLVAASPDSGAVMHKLVEATPASSGVQVTLTPVLCRRLEDVRKNGTDDERGAITKAVDLWLGDQMPQPWADGIFMTHRFTGAPYRIPTPKTLKIDAAVKRISNLGDDHFRHKPTHALVRTERGDVLVKLSFKFHLHVVLTQFGKYGPIFPVRLIPRGDTDVVAKDMNTGEVHEFFSPELTFAKAKTVLERTRV